jgi:hypothetical protein
MKFVKIKDQGDARIDIGWKKPWRLFVWTQTLQDPMSFFTYFQSCGD